MNHPSLPTALITGSSAGLGAEFARQLAQKKYNLALTARREDRLASFADELRRTYGVHVQVLAADLSTEKGVASIEQWIPTLPALGMLVNNAGYGIRGRFSNDPVEKQLAMIHVHILAAVRLSRAVLPGMLSTQHGAIINVASMAALFPIRNVTYSSTKAFIVNFSKSLQSELWGSGIKIQVLVPGYVHTEFHDTDEFIGYQKSSIPKLFWLEAPAVIRQSLRDLEEGKLECIPSWQYKTAAYLVRAPFTAALANKFVHYLYSKRGK